MQLTKRRIFGIISAAITCLILVSAVVGYINQTAFEANYENLRAGDPKTLVIDRLGKPQEIRHCWHPEGTDTFSDPCREEYWYFSFMERRIIYLDNEGRVIDKSYGVSP